MNYHDPEERKERLIGLVERYRAGIFSTVVFTASLKAMRMTGDEIGELVCQHIFAHQDSLPYKRGEIQ